MNKEFFERGIEEIIEEKSFWERIKSGKKLRIKIGLDPTKPDIHLGHTVELLRLRELQDEGHQIVVIVGDYTTKIGDPSGRNTTRPVLSDKEIRANAKTYCSQIGKILNTRKLELVSNSRWFSKMSFNDILQVAGKFTVARIIERDDFEKRLKEGRDIGLHEVLYPLMQAYDSIMVESDVEFGGTDQKFNILAGRDLQKKVGEKPQEAVFCKILVGTDGKDKMSKSLGNYIGITEDAKTMFGKVMSIKDELIIEYFRLATKAAEGEIKRMEVSLKAGENPKIVKEKLAIEIVTMYHNDKAAHKAKEEFNKVHAQKELPTEIPEAKLSGEFSVVNLLSALKAVHSNSEARRLIIQGGVKIDGSKITDPLSVVSAHSGMVVQVGKLKFYKIK